MMNGSSFRKWVQSLTWNELQAAMEFALDPDKNEDDLFLKMVREQAPLPNAIHPRVLPGKKASRSVVDDDGQNSLERLLRARIQQPRLFQWVETGKKQPLMMNPRKSNNKRDRRIQPVYDFIARKFVVNGERLSLGCTNEQRTADERILVGTVVVEDPLELSRRVLSRRVRFCAESSVREDCSSSRGVTKTSDALRILHVASRGHFLSYNGTEASSWFQPTERWFSLSMYLSSRFERALWESFSRRRVVEQSPCRWMPPDLLPSSYVLESMIESAVASALLSILRNDRKELEATHYPPKLCLEFLLENPSLVVFSASAANNMKLGYFPHFPRRNVVACDLNRFLMCDIVLVDSPLDELRRETCRLLYESLVCFCQKQLEASFLENKLQQSDHIPMKPSKRKRNKRGKLKRKQDITSMIMEVEEDDIVDTSDNDDQPLEAIIISNGSKPISFPDNGTCQRDRNRNTVLCMSILQEILTEVFDAACPKPDINACNNVAPHVYCDSGSEKPSCEGEISDMREASDRSSPDTATKSLEWKNANRSIGSTVQESVTASSESDCNDFKVQGSDHSTSTSVVRLSNTPPVPETPEQHFGRGDIQPSHTLIADSASRETPALDSFAAQYGTIGGTFYHRPEPGYVWDLNEDDWGRIQGHPSREHSLLADFFKGGAFTGVDLVERGTHEIVMASSTAASVDSHSDKADAVDELGDASDRQTCPVSIACSPDQQQCDVEVVKHEQSSPHSRAVDNPCGEHVDTLEARSPSPQAPATPSPTLSPILVSLADLKDLQKDVLHLKNTNPEVLELPIARSSLSLNASSLPSSPYTKHNGMDALSREDFAKAIERDCSKRKTSPKSCSAQAVRHSNLSNRVVKSRDDQDLGVRQFTLRKSADALSSYRNSFNLAKAKDDHDIKHSGFRSMETVPSKPRPSCRSASSPVMASTPESLPRPAPAHLPFDVGPQQLCARSEIALDGQEDHWQISQRSHSAEEGDNNTVTRDGSTTISSAVSHREPGELSLLREERNAYRDMCLTLGAEVAKLNNLLAAQRGATSASRHGHTYGIPVAFQGATFFGPEAVSNPFSLPTKARTLAAMSDAGYKGEHESLASEDDAGGRQMMGDTVRHTSSGTTFVGSDVSIDPADRQGLIHLPQSIPPQRDVTAIAFHGTQSRLAREVFQFVESVNLQLRKQDPKRRLAVERMTRLVNTLWPRAQVKLYGSHVTGLCLPSSDLDFVIRLPAVHKKAVAVAPGALEGRNAINETSQKLLARKLKGESWIDPRSMKLIERTVVPVIKVSTKDTKAKMIQLDITFDAPGHHGIEAVRVVSQMLEELPMTRPLVLVLKQFLLDRGLLTAYTGGLSSYCLFLMVARYLQEQSSAYGDGGSLLMGFLDFYGNHFDPRSTGMSVSRREYFARPTYGVARIQPAPQPPTHMWNPPHFLNQGPGSAYGTSNTNFFRRNSFSDKPSSVDCMRGSGSGPILAIRPPRFQTASPLPYQANFVGPVVPNAPPPPPPPPPPQDAYSQDNHRIPYTFDPLWVEDPLSETNNVGRNAFRFLQVQRAFSDAHRALVAALEWDMQSTGELQDVCHEYPLLKCLLRSEDLVFEL